MAKRKTKKETKKESKATLEESSRKDTSKNQNKILKNFIVGMISILVLIFLIVLVTNLLNSFEYQGMKFKIVKFCDSKPCLITYNTEIPVIYQGKNTTYNFYLRNDPRKLEENVPFNGNLSFRDLMILNSTSDFNCEGKGIIAVANLLNLYEIIDIKVGKDKNATCDSIGRYMFVNLKESNETSVEWVGPACYNININNCEILEGTERFMIETFVEIHKRL